MRKLEKLEISQLKSLMTDDRWQLVVRLMNHRLNEINAQEITGTNAFETLRALHQREGGTKALLEFFDSIDTGAFND